MDAEHIVKSYDEELKDLNDTIAQMGGLTEAQIARAIEALIKRDPELAEAVTELDTDDAIEILEDLDEEEQREVLASVPVEERAAVEEGLGEPEVDNSNILPS